MGGEHFVNRSAQLARLDERFDVLVLGGGATGLGTAVDAAARGYRTALVEAADFANATSSRSTKLVHGGVRYLQNGDVHLVREALHERIVMRKNAPHLVRALPFLCPIYNIFEGPYYLAGLKAYDVLAGSKNFGHSRWVGRCETLRRMPGLRKRGLYGSVQYWDGQFDDSRLAVALARTATDLGAVVVNYARAVRFLCDGERVSGAVVRDEEGGGEHEVRARAVVNATGIFVDALRQLDDPHARKLLALSRGTHVVFAQAVFGGHDALLVPRTDDGRVLFAIPWHDHVVVGTTDVPAESAELDPAPSRDEVDYILHHFNRYLEHPIQRGAALAAYAGLRPLVSGDAASTAKLSREHFIDIAKSGIVTITGGKWTTYRKMAEDAVDTAIEAASLSPAPSVTADLALHGSTGAAPPRRGDAYAGYGTDETALRSLEAEDASLATPLHPRLPYTRAEVVFAAREEMARTVDDVLSRRTRALFVDVDAAREAAGVVAGLMARELGRPPEWESAQVAAFEAIAGRDAAPIR
jgi:glycerol-3-phosphate dehydrogenase